MSDYVRYQNSHSHLLNGRLPAIDIELTERCNNACVHCYINLPANAKVARDQELTTDEVKDILCQAADLGCMVVRFTGGEPLLRPDFEEIYEYTRRLGVRVILFTNACLLTQRIIDLFKRLPPMEKIEVTSYGMHPQSYAAITLQTGGFEAFQRGVNLLIENNIPFVIKSVLLPANQDEVGELEKWAASLPGMTDPPPTAVFFELRNRRDDPGKNEQIRKLRYSPYSGVDFMLRDPSKFEEFRQNFLLGIDELPGAGLFACGAGDGRLSVDAYGRIQPCLEMRAPEITLPKGTLLRLALEEFQSLRKMNSENVEYLERCAKCFLRNICEQCPAKAWSETGSLDTPIEYYCEVTHELARRLGWLAGSEKSWEIKDWKSRVRSH